MQMNNAARRWRLALGRYSEDNLGGLQNQDQHMDDMLEFVYGREYEKRGLRTKSASLDATQITALDWLGKARNLFPQNVFETIQSDALNQYGMTELFADPDFLSQIEPRQDLLPVLLSFHSRASDELKTQLRAVAQKVIDEITERLRTNVLKAFSGRRNRFMRSNIAAAANFDWRATFRENLSRYDVQRERIVAERLKFNARVKRQIPWTVVLCVDQSGSMTDSVIHSAVLAAILSGLPGVKVKMVLFDTSIVDVTEKLADPIDTLLSVQLGGGTDIAQALQYCEGLIDNPTRTVFALITDFFEGGSVRAMLSVIGRLAEARVVQLGIPSLDNTGQAWYNQDLAAEAQSLGMNVAALSPDKFAAWLAEIIT